MKKIWLSALAFFAFSAHAACSGDDYYRFCTDENSGNQYTITRQGDVTNLQGYNHRTGSRWTQRSETIGCTVYHRGIDADGNHWSTTTAANAKPGCPSYSPNANYAPNYSSNNPYAQIADNLAWLIILAFDYFKNAPPAVDFEHSNDGEK